MRKLAFILVACGALTVSAPALAASGATGAAQTQQVQPAQKQQATEFSSHRRRYWHRHRHWHRPHYYRPHYYYGRHCRTVWNPYRGWVRVCRWY